LFEFSNRDLRCGAAARRCRGRLSILMDRATALAVLRLLTAILAGRCPILSAEVAIASAGVIPARTSRALLPVSAIVPVRLSLRWAISSSVPPKPVHWLRFWRGAFAHASRGWLRRPRSCFGMVYSLSRMALCH
jgi:hypothetical protein